MLTKNKKDPKDLSVNKLLNQANREVPGFEKLLHRFEQKCKHFQQLFPPRGSHFALFWLKPKH